MQIIRDTSATGPEPCVATIGFFDGVHAGHRYLIRQVREIAAARGLRSALVTFPIHPRKVMNADYAPQLLTTLDEKIELLSGLDIDYCLMLDFTPDLAQLTAQEFMTTVLKERYRVQCLVIGYDHRFGHNRSEGFEEYVRYGEAIGIEVIRAKAFSERLTTESDNAATISSSLIRKLLLAGDVESAGRALEYPYFLEGTVVDGYQVGRTIGYPTANICATDPAKLIPGNGVYAVWIRVDGREWMGMLSIGVRPTFGDGLNRTIEVNILHFNADIYEKKVRLTFIRRMRSEAKFTTVDALIRQLRRDAEEAEHILQADRPNFHQEEMR
jgi:riboflavin kinase/FMN adenylyltransferase